MKKLVIIILSIITVLALSYTGAWFFIKNKAENNIELTLNKLKKDSKFKYITYDLKTSCFPFLCLELKDLKIKTDKYFAVSKKGFEFEAFVEKTLTYETKNIFKPLFNFNKKQASFDFKTKNLDTDQEVTFMFNFDDLTANFAKKDKNISISHADIEASAANSAFLAVASVDQLNLNYDLNKTSDELSDLTFGYSLSNLRIFNQGAKQKPLTISHSLLKAKIKDIANQTLTNLTKSKENTKEFSIETLNNLANNKTNLIIEDFKFSTDTSQALLKGHVLIDNDNRLRTNFDSSIKFLKDDTALENVIKNYKFKKHDSNTYFINGRTNDELINVNNIIRFPRPRIF